MQAVMHNRITHVQMYGLGQDVLGKPQAVADLLVADAKEAAATVPLAERV